MKIKVAIVERDKGYLERISRSLSTRYPDDIQLYAFTDLDKAMAEIEKNKINLLIATEEYEVDTEKIPYTCAFAYLVDYRDVETVRGKPAVCKFQKTDLLYKQMLSLYSEIAADIKGVKYENDNFRQIVFTSPCGGVGTSTMAAAYALRSARKGHQVLYLNLETFGSADTFFRADGLYDMSDIVYALKTRRSNITMKIESCVKQDASGVYFLSQSKSVLDILELTYEERKELLNIFREQGKYDMIIIDCDFTLSEDNLRFLQQMDAIVLVSDGSVFSNVKMFRAYDAVREREMGSDLQVGNRMMVAYNQYDQETGNLLAALDIKELGVVPKYRGATTEQLLVQLANMSVFDALG